MLIPEKFLQTVRCKMLAFMAAAGDNKRRLRQKKACALKRTGA